jgi:hypothetical protein
MAITAWHVFTFFALATLSFSAADPAVLRHIDAKAEEAFRDKTSTRAKPDSGHKDRNCSYLSGRQLTDCQCKASLSEASSVWSRGDVSQSYKLTAICNTSSPALRWACRQALANPARRDLGQEFMGSILALMENHASLPGFSWRLCCGSNWVTKSIAYAVQRREALSMWFETPTHMQVSSVNCLNQKSEGYAWTSEFPHVQKSNVHNLARF